VKEDPKFVANGRFQARCPLEGQGETSFLPLFTFLPTNFDYTLFFIDFKVLLYHDSTSLLYVFPSFSLTYKLQPHILMY